LNAWPAHCPELVQIVGGGPGKESGTAYAWPAMSANSNRPSAGAAQAGIHWRSRPAAPDLRSELGAGLDAGSLTADELLAGYCRLLHTRLALTRRSPAELDWIAAR
jgi:hypothetical protein